MPNREGRARVVIQAVQPELDCGRHAIKRIRGEKVIVEADIFTDGHDMISALLLYREDGAEQWNQAVLEPLVNDRWRGMFSVSETGRYRTTIQAWVDHFKTWRRDLVKRVAAAQDLSVDLLIGANLMEMVLPATENEDREMLMQWVAELKAEELSQTDKIRVAMNEVLAELMEKHSHRELATQYDKILSVTVDREKAGFSAWYEMFPRSTSPQAGGHGTFKDCIARLPFVAEMGFDILYLPPIHPIGRTHRKGRNNATEAEPDDVGSPWAIGSAEGGHKSIHPRLGTLEDFHDLLAGAKDYGIELAMDIAFQASPDHPLVKEHSEWFRRRPDEFIQYAENPPKKYEDIYPFDFESGHWRELWEELKSVFYYWIEQGVRIFRVDNPHTKPFPFWDDAINEIKKQYPEVIFLAEAFTRPKVMYELAKLGFTQSYTYFSWRNTQWEIMQYFNELTKTQAREFFRPNLWPNTPDILTEYLQMGGRPAFAARLVLAATLGANYGIYGPAFELFENHPRSHGSEEYLDSEKYEIRHWDINRQDSLRHLIARVNAIRRTNPALQNDWSLRFHAINNEQMICYTKHDVEMKNILLMVVNLDPRHTQSGWVNLRLSEDFADLKQSYQAHDLLSEERYLWQGEKNFVQLNPQVMPAAIYALRRRLRTERDFEYFL